MDCGIDNFLGLGGNFSIADAEDIMKKTTEEPHLEMRKEWRLCNEARSMSGLGGLR